MAKLAKVIESDSSGITFLVDEVVPAARHVKTHSRSDTLEVTLDRNLIAVSDPEIELVKAKGGEHYEEERVHPLVETIYKSFCEHRPLELRPDDFAIAVAQGFAQHVCGHAEELRDKLVSHQGKITVIVKTDGSSDWETIIEAFSESVRQDIDPSLAGLLSCDYSTTTPASRIACEVVLLKAFERYYDYILVCICGIPQIKLCGQPEDWRRLLGRLDCLTGFGLDNWVSRLQEILLQLVATSEGAPNLNFWKAICKPKKTYGAELISGWLIDLFPYLRDGEDPEQLRPNPMLDIPRKNWVLDADKDELGISPVQFPQGLSEAVFTMITITEKSEKDFVGGFLGVEQTDSGSLRPAIGWAVADARSNISGLLREIESQHEVVRRTTDDPHLLSGLGGAPKFIVAFASKFEMATINKGSEREWKLGGFYNAAYEENDPLESRPAEFRQQSRPVIVFAESASGEVLAFEYSRGQFGVISAQLADPQPDTPKDDPFVIWPDAWITEVTHFADDATEAVLKLLAP